MKNNYPAKFINKAKKKMEKSEINRNYQQNDKKYNVAPSIKKNSERVAKILLLFNIQLASKPNNKLRNHLCNLRVKRLKTDEAGFAINLIVMIVLLRIYEKLAGYLINDPMNTKNI